MSCRKLNQAVTNGNPNLAVELRSARGAVSRNHLPIIMLWKVLYHLVGLMTAPRTEIW